MKRLSMGLLLIALIWFVQADRTRELTYQPLIVSNSPAEKVLFELYYESMCPFCHKYITRTLKKLLQTPDILRIAEFKLVPFGNAEGVRQGNKYEFECQHGEEECLGNILHGCALKNYDLVSQVLPFLLCLEESDKNWLEDGRICALKGGLSWETLFGCTIGVAGQDHHFMNGLLTKTVPLNGVPFVLINGQPYESSNELGKICKSYKGFNSIAACQA